MYKAWWNSRPREQYKDGSNSDHHICVCTSLPMHPPNSQEEMSTLTVQFFHGSRGRRWVVGALVLAVMALVCNQAGASRFYPPRHSHHSPPPPPPPENFLRPPLSSQLQGHTNYHSGEHMEGVHDPALHHGRSLMPLLRKKFHQKEIDTHNTQPLTLPGRRLFSEEHLAKEHSGIEHFPLGSGSLLTSCAPQAGHSGHPPVGSPAPPPTSGSDDSSKLPPLPLSPLPSLSPPANSNNNSQAHTTVGSAMKHNQCTYTIVTSTGNIEGAGTTADVNAKFFDEHGNYVLFVNLKSQNRNFDQGATDTFTVVGDCVWEICGMHLSHDDAGPDPSWFVNTVTVSLMYQSQVFNVFEWLSKTEPPYSLSRTISSCPAVRGR